MRFFMNAWYISCSVSALFFLGAYLLLQTLTSPQCSNEIQHINNSPNGRHQAVVFSRSCDESSALTAHVSILASGKTLPNDEGNVFSASLHNAGLIPLVDWQNNRQITIDAAGITHVSKAKTALQKPRAIAIQYHTSKDISYAFD